jgi:CBS domain containing-hemolysin-like protein
MYPVGGVCPAECGAFQLEITVNLILVAILIALTAFFVVSEFAFVKVRVSRIDQLIEENRAGALAAKHVVTHLDEFLSACQLGITITALGLGWLGEPTMDRLLHPLFEAMGLNPSLSNVLSFGLAFAIITFLHVVMGELAPKTIAIVKAESVTLWCAKPMIWFYRIMYPFIWLLNGSARLLVGLFGMKPASEHEMAHSEEELRIILSESYKSGEINKTELTYVNNIFEFDNRIAKEIMVPRTEMVTLSIDDDFDTILNTIKNEKYTRYPVVAGGNKDNVLGVVNIKEILIANMNNRSNGVAASHSLEKFIKPIIRAIETIPIQDLLVKMQKEHVHMAILLDEYGGTAGLVTVEDILEEIVGDIRDEFDVDELPEVQKIDEDHYIFSGKVLIEDVNDLLGISLVEEDVDTLAGWFLTHQFDVKSGDTLTAEGFSFTVREIEGQNHILSIEVKKA